MVMTVIFDVDNDDDDGGYGDGGLGCGCVDDAAGNAAIMITAAWQRVPHSQHVHLRVVGLAARVGQTFFMASGWPGPRDPKHFDARLADPAPAQVRPSFFANQNKLFGLYGAGLASVVRHILTYAWPPRPK